MFCFKFAGKFALVGSSPEGQVRAMVASKVEIRPVIAASAPSAVQTREEDEANARDLLADPKERAEHLMLVDLAHQRRRPHRGFPGAVRVTDFMTIEKYIVMHIVSNVIGALLGLRNAYDVMRATFPGLVSGSPKRCARCRSSTSLKKASAAPTLARSATSGSDGNLDSCITLRTIVPEGWKSLPCRRGGAVLPDSTRRRQISGDSKRRPPGMMRAIERINQNQRHKHASRNR